MSVVLPQATSSVLDALARWIDHRRCDVRRFELLTEAERACKRDTLIAREKWRVAREDASLSGLAPALAKDIECSSSSLKVASPCEPGALRALNRGSVFAALSESAHPAAQRASQVVEECCRATDAPSKGAVDALAKFDSTLRSADTAVGGSRAGAPGMQQLRTAMWELRAAVAVLTRAGFTPLSTVEVLTVVVMKERAALRTVCPGYDGATPRSSRDRSAPAPREPIAPSLGSGTPQTAEEPTLSPRAAAVAKREAYWTAATTLWAGGRGDEALTIWGQHLRLLVRLQALVRGRVARSSVDDAASTRRAAQEARLRRLHRGAMPGYTQRLPLSAAYASAIAEVEVEERCLEEFFDTEPAAFQEQWREWERHMKRFYLEECPLDQDWSVHQPPAGAPPGAKTVYANRATGRTQEEHPNTLKIVAARQREQYKAERAREERLAKAQSQVDAVQQRRAELFDLEAKMARHTTFV